MGEIKTRGNLAQGGVNMPTYDYKCLACGKSFEAFQKMSEAVLKECPDCKGEVKRLIGSGSGLIFKGSGFYQTDYKNKELKKPKKDQNTPCSSCDNSACSNAKVKDK